MSQTIDGAGLRYELQERGYAELEHGIQPEQIDNLAVSYFDFTAAFPDPDPETIDAMLPETPANLSDSNWLDELNRSQDQQTEWHKYRTNTDDPIKPNGYTNRFALQAALRRTRGVFIGEDPKEYYHWMPGHHSDIAAQHRLYDWGPIPPDVTRLTMAFGPIHKQATALIMKVCAEIEDQHPGIRSIMTPQGLKASPLRFLGYRKTEAEYLGAGHYDKSDITLQIAESHEGLMVAPEKHQQAEHVLRDATKAVVFMGKNLTHPEGGRYPDSPYHPGWHGIKRLETANQGRRPLPLSAQEKFSRWALIFFANSDPSQRMILGKADTHNR